MNYMAEKRHKRWENHGKILTKIHDIILQKNCVQNTMNPQNILRISPKKSNHIRYHGCFFYGKERVMKYRLSKQEMEKD